MTTPADPQSFSDICGDLPDHASEVMTAHQCVPGPAQQAYKKPPVDNGPPTGPDKYGGMGSH